MWMLHFISSEDMNISSKLGNWMIDTNTFNIINLMLLQYKYIRLYIMQPMLHIDNNTADMPLVSSLGLHLVVNLCQYKKCT